jgi:hypothetical protein
MLKQVVWSVMLAVLALTPKASAQPAGPSVRLDKLFERDMLNVQVPYLESVLGPAKRIHARAEGGHLREYWIKGCVVFVLIIDNETRASGHLSQSNVRLTWPMPVSVWRATQW